MARRRPPSAVARSFHLDAIAAELLGPIQRPVDDREQFRDRCMGIAAERDADADARRQVARCRNKSPLRRNCAAPDRRWRTPRRYRRPACRRRIPRRRCGQTGHRRRASASPSGKASAARIAHRVTEAVVDLLEVIEIEQQHRKRLMIDCPARARSPPRRRGRRGDWQPRSMGRPAN